MSLGAGIYKELLEDLRRECDGMVANGELSAEDAGFRFSMVSDEILDGMPDELFEKKQSKGAWDEDGWCRLLSGPCVHDCCKGCSVVSDMLKEFRGDCM